MGSNERLTVRERFRSAVRSFFELEESPERQDLETFQRKTGSLIHEFQLIELIVSSLSLFSDNEKLNEINTSYLPFAAIAQYLAGLYMKLLADVSNGFTYDPNDRLKYKGLNLQIAKGKLASFLVQLDNFGDILAAEQKKRLDSFETTYNPSNDEIAAYGGNAATRRAEKIANFKYERELRNKLHILDDYYKGGNEDDGDEIFNTFDEEVVRAVYIDLLKLYSLYAFNNLELIAMELQVLGNRPVGFVPKAIDNPEKKKSSEDDFGYTNRVEELPFKKKHISDLISKQGKILRPFVITNGKQDLQRQVFGTGQVLPSMSVEEYLDYELANGKMAAEGPKEEYDSGDEEEDSDAEIKQREWDDWKDENPKGAGNMKANIG